MTNLQVAKMYTFNGLAYARNSVKHGDQAQVMPTVIANLEYIEELLENPNAENPDHDWDDFK